MLDSITVFIFGVSPYFVLPIATAFLIRHRATILRNKNYPIFPGFISGLFLLVQFLFSSYVTSGLSPKIFGPILLKLMYNIPIRYLVLAGNILEALCGSIIFICIYFILEKYKFTKNSQTAPLEKEPSWSRYFFWIIILTLLAILVFSLN